MSDEVIKIAPNGQWSLEKANPRAYGMSPDSVRIGAGAQTSPAEGAPAPVKVPVYRGMTGLKLADLQKLGIKPEPGGGVHQTNKVVGMKHQGWWSDNPRLSLIYASVDHVNQKPSYEPTYDVFMTGEAEHPGTHMNLTHALRDKNSKVTMQKIVYMPRQGTGDERAQRIREQLPDLEWVKPLQKSKLIKPKNLQLPKNPNVMYMEKDRPGVGYTENGGVYNPEKDFAYVGTKGTKDMNEYRGNGVDIAQDAYHHEHQHRLNSLAGRQLKIDPPPLGMHDVGNALSHHLWNNSGLSEFEKEASRLVNRFNNGYSSHDPDENLACLVGWLNGGTKNREYILKQIDAHEDRNISADEVDGLMRSAFKKIQNTANQLKPGQTIKNPFPY